MCGWYVYLAVMAVLVSLSAGPRSPTGLVALAAAVASVFLLATLVRPYPDALVLAAKVTVLAAGLLALLPGARSDTRHIGLLLAAAAALPLFLHFWTP